MTYTDKLIEFAERGECPGCWTKLVNLAGSWESGLGNNSFKYCSCCGWTVSRSAGDYSFGNMPPDPRGETIYVCVLEHPEHRARWPQPERIEDQPDEYTPLEIAQR